MTTTTSIVWKKLFVFKIMLITQKLNNLNKNQVKKKWCLCLNYYSIRALWVWQKAYLNMCHTMIVQVGTSSESFATYLTLMWLLTRMDSSMCVEWAWCTESFETYSTYMRFFTCEKKNTVYFKSTVKFIECSYMKAKWSEQQLPA